MAPIRTTKGAVYIAYGRPAVDAAWLSIKSLNQVMPHLPVVVVADGEAEKLCKLPLVTRFYLMERDEGGRFAKVSLSEISPFELTVYVDADTCIHETLEGGFQVLEDGWDVAITPSLMQGDRMLWHVGGAEKSETLAAWPCPPLQLQGGLIFFRKNESVGCFFKRWREEWMKYQDQDQGALLRALADTPVKVWLLGRPWNGGQVMNHLFGLAKRRGAG